MIDLASVIRPGDGVIFGQACAEPQTLVEALVAQRAAFSGAGVFLGVNYAGILKPAHADHLRLSAYCGIGHNRALADAGALDIQPIPYSQIGTMIRSGKIRADVVMLQVSPPNARGEYSLGLAADYVIPALQTARVVVAEVNAQVPWTHTEKRLRREDFVLLVESSRPPAAPPPAKNGEVEPAIARHAAPFIPDGATLEFGIGALPDAVCRELGRHARLVVHSGTVGDGIVELMRAGVVTATDCAMLIGTRKLFDFARDNPSIRLRSSEYTHDPRVLAGIERFVAINSAVEVDLTGQVNAEVARGSYVGAVGGALDFVRAANQSAGGVAITVLPAYRVVERLSGPVATPRSEAGVIVTERGAADLRGCSLRERERRLRAICYG
ncbi:MAG TPA: acetyl-CoA hydrolase/transferase C-terminal domain-containing protein [Burkholderiales bacterium]|nr:acetyl-CoA hydrolase/transferase C-terminal domain-containing protein [Burkholderiales bacterium]